MPKVTLSKQIIHRVQSVLVFGLKLPRYTAEKRLQNGYMILKAEIPPHIRHGGPVRSL